MQHVFRPDPPSEVGPSHVISKDTICSPDEDSDDDIENTTQHDEEVASDFSSENEEHSGNEQSNEEYEEPSSQGQTKSNSYPSPRAVIYPNGSHDDAETRIGEMLDYMSNIQTTLVIKGKKVARERRMERMREHSADAADDNCQ